MAREPESIATSQIGVSLVWLLLLASLVSVVSRPAHAQHAIDPETWIEMRMMYRVKGPVPTVEEDVAALGGPEAKRAGPRLIDRGPEVLPAIHSALRSPDLKPRHALALLQVVSAFEDEGSVPVVLELIGRGREYPLRRDALFILALLPATDEAAAAILEIASDADEDWKTRRMAFTWFGFHRDPRGRPYAEALRTDTDPERRTAALFVLARLGDKSVLEPIGQLLASGAPGNSRDALLFGLAEITTPEAFERIAPSSLAWSRGYKESLLYARYSAASPQEKIRLCLEMLRSQHPGHRELAVQCLLANGHAEDLRPHAALDMESPGRAALIRNDIRKAGWRIIDTDDEFSIVPLAP